MTDHIVYPRAFAAAPKPGEADAYLDDPAIGQLAEFFQAKGLAALKDEDAREVWYQDWLDYQAEHRLYASLLSPKRLSAFGHELDLLRIARFLEVFGYFSPAHGYSLQVTFLGFFSILAGANEDLKREAVKTLEGGGLMAFGVSEKAHGSDLLANEFVVKEMEDGGLIAGGGKYYIGNSNCAAIISILAKRERASGEQHHHAQLTFFALRTKRIPGFANHRKIRTFGIRAAFVGDFQVKDYQVPSGDIIAEGRDAWDAVFGTVTLGKFFLGFGSIGICERAMEEAVAHMSSRVLYRKPVLEMPHIRLAAAQAYARLTAMRLYAYRAVDYVHAANADDRRYMLYCAVQKAKVSTEGVKVIAQLSECIGARGFEAETYFESALRDIQLIPGLEGSTHINITHAFQFIPGYFARREGAPPDPRSLMLGETSGENSYLMEARADKLHTVLFADYLNAYGPLRKIFNVRLFRAQIRAFQRLVASRAKRPDTGPSMTVLALGQCMTTIAYGQLIAENAVRLRVDGRMVSAIFHLLVLDLSAAGQSLAALPESDATTRAMAQRLIAIPRTAGADWNFVAGLFDPRRDGAKGE